MTQSRSDAKHRRTRRASEADFRAVVDALPEAVFLHRDGVVLYVNRALLDALGYEDAKEFVGRPVVDAFVAPISREAFSRSLETGLPHDLPIDVECLSRDGTSIQLRTRQVLARFEGAPAWVVSACDVTAQRKLDECIIQTERTAAVDTLTAGVAHEINNPLAALMANLEYLGHQVHELAGSSLHGRVAELGEALRDTRLAADCIRRIVRGMGTLSGVDDERRAVIEIPMMLDAAIAMTVPLIRHRGRLVRDYQIVPRVKADETQLIRVFVNLLTNAAQALPNDRVAQNELRVSVFTNERGDAVIEFRDNGQGILPEVQKRMFDPFFTTKRPGGATGLGLTVAHAVVRGIGGHIECDSEPCFGSIFRVVLPPLSHSRPRSPRSRLWRRTNAHGRRRQRRT